MSPYDINLKNIEKNAIPIFLSSDNNYAPFVATTIASICDNTYSFCNFISFCSNIRINKWSS